MSSRFDLLTQQLFQKTISDCSVDDLQKLVDEYPYFAPAHFALVKKLEEENNPLHQAELQKAVLYYHTPPLFDHFLNEENYVMDVSFLSIPDEIQIVETESEEERSAEEASHEIASPEISGIPEISTDVRASVQENITPTEYPSTKIESISTEINEPITNGEIKSSEEAFAEVADTKKETPETEALAFEPYHTIDYFASQGIKLSQEEATKDQLGKQLKSFTEWLKTMKRLPVEQAKPIDPVLERKVDTLAAHSVDRAEVLTETMAEVWVAQGNTEKAIETYHKLSLLNPSKRAYFAAKVDFLKKEI